MVVEKSQRRGYLQEDCESCRSLQEDDERRDWSTLPSDLLLLVAESLHLTDIAHLPAVCGDWACVLSRARKGWPPPPPPTLKAKWVPLENSSPWLLLPNEDDQCTEYCDFLRFSESQNGVPRIRISLPEMGGRICVGGSPDGWIATVDIWLNPRILNPLTKEEFPLPCLCTLSAFSKMVPIYSNNGDGSMCTVFRNKATYCREVSFEKFRYQYVRKIILFSTPPLGIAFLIHGKVYGDTKLAMARVGDLAWTPAVDHKLYRVDADIEDVVWNEKDRMFYAISGLGRLFVIDLNNYHWGTFQLPEHKVVSSRLPCHLISEKLYLVVSSNDDLLLVLKRFDVPFVEGTGDTNGTNDTSLPVIEETVHFKVLKFCPNMISDGENTNSCWIPVDELGDNAMFLGLNYSTCVSTSDKPWLRRNSVYYIDDRIREKEKSTRICQCQGGIYDLKTNKFEKFFPLYSKAG